MLDVTHSQVDVETEVSVVVYQPGFNKMIFSIFQVSRDRER